MAQYIDKSATIAKIKEIYNEDYKFLPSDIVESVRDFKDDLLAALDTFEAKELKEETVSDELEEAAQEYVTKEGYLAGLHYNSMVRSFKAGAKWQKKQMMANTADAMIGLPYENKDGGYTHIIDVSRPLPVGNNKIAIIFKEE